MLRLFTCRLLQQECTALLFNANARLVEGLMVGDLAGVMTFLIVGSRPHIYFYLNLYARCTDFEQPLHTLSI